MAGRTTVAAGVAALALVAAGCGTVNNLTGPGKDGLFGRTSEPRIYGGVQDELSVASEMVWNNPQSVAMNVMIITLFGLDFPLTVIGDTVTLPLTIPAEVSRGIRDYYFPPERPVISGDCPAKDEKEAPPSGARYLRPSTPVDQRD